MKKLLFILCLALLAMLPAMAMAASNTVKVDVAEKGVAFNLSNDQELAGLAVALKFAEKNDDVSISSVSFEGTRLEYLSFKEAIINNEEKTVVVFGIVLQEEYIKPGEGPIALFTFSGDVSKVQFTSTLVGQQEGVTLVTPAAEAISSEFNDDFDKSALLTLPKQYDLAQNYPNPFNATTQIKYQLPQNAHVTLYIYNILGQKVKTLVDEEQAAGYKQIIWDGNNDKGDVVASGVYFYRIRAGIFSEVRQMTLLK